MKTTRKPRPRGGRLGDADYQHEHAARESVSRAEDAANIALDFANDGRCKLAVQALIDAEVAHGVAKREVRHAKVQQTKVKSQILDKAANMVEQARDRVLNTCVVEDGQAGKTRFR